MYLNLTKRCSTKLVRDNVSSQSATFIIAHKSVNVRAATIAMATFILVSPSHIYSNSSDPELVTYSSAYEQEFVATMSTHTYTAPNKSVVRTSQYAYNGLTKIDDAKGGLTVPLPDRQMKGLTFQQLHKLQKSIAFLLLGIGFFMPFGISFSKVTPIGGILLSVICVFSSISFMKTAKALESRGAE